MNWIRSELVVSGHPERDRSYLLDEVLRAMSWRNVEIARRCFSRFAARDVSGFIELLDPDVDWVPAIAVVAPHHLVYSTYRGQSGVRQWFADLERWSDYRVESDEFRAAGDNVLVTGKVFLKDNQRDQLYDVWFVFAFRRGKVVSARTFSDRAEALEAAGLSDQ